ncbi:MAG: ABC transporter permease [Planctomycetes bacterium]|nr:ABC transporter permease [Planctomycetota bacterium]
MTPAARFWIRFAARRAARALIVIFIVAAASFFLLRAAPGGPFSGDRALPPSILRIVEERYRLNDPIYLQFFHYLQNLLRGDLGPSFRNADFTVQDLIAIGLPKTAAIGACALLFAIGIGLPLGVAAAARRSGAIDRIAGGIAVAGLAVPNFVLGPFLVMFFSLILHWFEPGGLEAPADLVLPAVALGMGPLAVILRLARAGMLDVLSLDYIQFARAKGLRERTILFRHALPGAISPVLTYLGPACAAILAGSLVVESIFSIPGIGGYVVRGAANRDYPLVMGVVLLGTAFLVIMNTIVDALYAAIDPRIRRS